MSTGELSCHRIVTDCNLVVAIQQLLFEPSTKSTTIEIYMTIVSIIVVSIFVLIMSTFWACNLLALKYAGHQKVGFLAGGLIEPDPTKKLSPRASAEFLSVIQEADKTVEMDEGE